MDLEINIEQHMSGWKKWGRLCGSLVSMDNSNIKGEGTILFANVFTIRKRFWKNKMVLKEQNEIYSSWFFDIQVRMKKKND